MSVEVELKGLVDGLAGYFRGAAERAERAEVLAVRDAARMARSESSKEIRSQVNFSVSYLNQAGRLELAIGEGGKAATLTGRHRATSLARFATTPFGVGRDRPKRGIRVKVNKRSAGVNLNKHYSAFFVRLKNGNQGLAVRTKDGRAPSAGAKPIFGGNAFLLYGPSVGQVAFDVFPDIAPDVANKLSTEFLRHFERLQ